MIIETKKLFTILATAIFEMTKHPEDFTNTLPVARELLITLFTKFNQNDELFIDKKPF